MTCPSDDLLRQLLDQTNEDTSSTAIIGHLAECPDCKTRIDAWGEQLRLQEILRDFHEVPAVFNVTPGIVDGATNSYAVPTRRRIGQYELLRSIGRGGGGEVFEARHTLLQRRVAIKLLSAKHAGDEAARRRFFREMESIGQLDDHYIVRAHDAGEVDGTLYLAMELVDGENLESLARRVGQLPVSDACEIIRQAATGLQHIHDSNLVHRDLKPSNLLLSKSGVKIADLGLALLDRDGLLDDRLTGHQTILGTADYMAPEQAEGPHHVDIRADIYSLGCTLFRLLGGRAPFAVPENTTTIKKMWAHASQPIPDILPLRPDIPPALVAVLRKMMAKDRHDRFAEPRDLAAAIEPFCTAEDLPSLVILKPAVPLLQGAGSTAKDPTDRSRKSSGTTPIVLSMTPWLQRPVLRIAFLICLVAGMFWWQNTKVPQPERATVSPTKEQDRPPPKVHDGPVAEPPVAPVPAPRPTAEQWRLAGLVPADLTWPNAGVGTWRIDEDLQGLALQANKAFRLVKLGEITRPDDGFTLAFDVVHPKTGEVGIFLGFQKPKGNLAPTVHFQSITIRSFRAASGQKLLVQRHLRTIEIHTTRMDSNRNHHMLFDYPEGIESLPVELQLANSQLTGLRVAGQDCIELYNDINNSQFSAVDFEGPFGVFTYDASVWFSNPRFKRNGP